MKKAVFEMVKYHSQEYPQGIPLNFEEIAAHFDVNSVNPQMAYSLHTEYSYGKRVWNSQLLTDLPELTLSSKDSVPELWKNEKWATEFAEFILRLTQGHNAPSVIEIHPPFSNYTDCLGVFVSIYKVFENKISKVYPNTEILIENRCGSIYQGGKFVLSKIGNILSLSKFIDNQKLKLRFALDFPQLFTAHSVSSKTPNKYSELVGALKDIRHNIGGVHLWGKRISATGRKVAHCGDLNSYFDYSDELVQNFMASFVDLFSDNITRKLVLEVNSGNEDLRSIIADLTKSEIAFV